MLAVPHLPGPIGMSALSGAAALFDDVHLVGLLVQAMGAALIGCLCLMQNRVARSAALSTWGWAWMSLGAALLALLIEQALPASAAGTLPLYLLGEYLFGYWVVVGCMGFGGREVPGRWRRLAILPCVAVSLALPPLIGHEFRRLFLVQSLALSIAFAAALLALAPAVRRAPSPGLKAMRFALTALAALFLSYPPLFAANLWWHQPLPMAWLNVSSAAHLLLEFLLGFGAAVRVLEQSNELLALRNGTLINDVARFRGQAEHDALTNAYNRRALLQRLADVLTEAERASTKVYLLYVDIDQFKDVNDAHGHAFGDHLLIAIAQRLQECVLPADFVVRMGGDEFMVITREAPDRHTAAELARRINAKVSEPLIVDEVQTRVQVSIGIGAYPDDGASADALMKYADIALYQAKSAGRNNFRFFNVEMNQIHQARMLLTRQLSAAVGTAQLFVEYQPVVNLRSNCIIGLEALIRWRHPDRGLVAPADFIPLAEQSGSINAVGEYVLREVCRQLRAWSEDFVPLVPIAVNVSPRQFDQGRLAEMFVRVVEDFEVDPALVRIEITETELMKNSREHLQTLRRLRELGFKISIDDFGTGYSSLSYLKNLPIDCLKIDRTFIGHMIGDSRDAAIVRGVIGIARSMGIMVVAEGVESADQAAELSRLDCVAAQGYFFHRPMSPDRCVPLLEALTQPVRSAGGAELSSDACPLASPTCTV